LEAKRIDMKEAIPASGYALTMLVNIINYPHWPAISILLGIILTTFMISYYMMKIYDQFLITRRRRKDDKMLDEFKTNKNRTNEK